MTMDRLQKIVWFTMPLLGLLVLVIALGARGGIWMVIPMSLLMAIILVFYLMYLRASSH